MVFLDYSLPGRDGLEVLEEIRRGEAPPPVVVVTGRGDEQVAVEAMKGGAYDYVVKGEGYLQRLPVVARRAVEAHQLAVERKRAEEAAPCIPSGERDPPQGSPSPGEEQHAGDIRPSRSPGEIKQESGADCNVP